MYIGSKEIGSKVPGDSPLTRAYLLARMLGYAGSVGLRLAASVAACAAVCAGAARAETVTAPCVSTGVLARIAPLGTVPIPVGPTLAAVDRESSTADSFADERTGSIVDHVELGVAGCVDTTGTPGGTALTTTAWSILGGAVSGTSLTVDLVPRPADGSGWHVRANAKGLGVALGDWGVLERQATIATPSTWWRAAFQLRLTKAHEGLAAGTRLLIGWVRADRPPAPAPRLPSWPRPKPAPATTTAITTTAITTTAPTTTTAKPHPKPHAKKKKHKPRGWHPSHEPLKATPPLGPGVYDFPVYGDTAWGDTYGGLRSDVPGGWHHGDDLFAPLGRPVLAVAEGTIFAVGWNKVGGWRLWLRDRWGNCFYYAHLAGYTKLAKNNGHVRRGQVLGFVGNTGDAFLIEAHLHFEVHPNELLYLGYDGAVNPTSYLASWHRADKIVLLSPVEPPSHHRGQGSLTDYRRLLALQPLKRKPAVKLTAGPERRIALESRAERLAKPSRGDGWGAAGAAAGLLAAAGFAVAIAARRGAQAR
jgi:Peptidase family M23